MTSLTIDLEKIEFLISKGNYENAAEEIFGLIESTLYKSDKELIYKSLNLLNLICDKTPSISLKSVKMIESIINDSDSWIRLVSLEILYQISMYRPNLLIELMSKIRDRLFDQDASVRRLTVKIIGTLILSLHIDLEVLQDLIDEFIEKLMDNDWKVKLHVIKTLQKIINQDFTKIRDLEPLFSIVIVNLRDDDDDVARAAAELLKTIGTYFLSKEKILNILLNLLYNEKSRVKELIIWLFGEIGNEKSSEIISIIPKLINLLKENDYRIQIKVIDTLVNIAENNLDQIWANLIHSLLDTADIEFRNNLINALYHLSQNNLSEILPYLFEELESPSENIREGIALIFRRLFEEYQIEIENEITRILYKLESKYWRERKKGIILLDNICHILKSKKIAVWIDIELNKILKTEEDPSVKDEIIYLLKNIKASFKGIDESIEKINNELSLLQIKIHEFRKIPAQFREKLTFYIEEFRFNSTEIQLNKMYSGVMKKINVFHEKINRFEYKRLAFDLLEEWEETKIQIIDELSIIKGFISEICEAKKTEYVSNLDNKIGVMDNRINILKAKFDHIKNYKLRVDLNEDKDLEENFAYISQIRKSLFILDGDIREILIQNLEFNDNFEGLLRKWIGIKIEIQEYLNDLDGEIKIMKENIISYHYQIKKSSEIPDREKISGLNNELAFQLLQGHFQSIIFQGIEGIKKCNDNFKILNSKLDFMIKKKEFTNVKKLIEMNSIQIQTFIEETEKQMDRIIRKEKIFQDNNVFTLFVRPYINKFDASKELLINKLKSFIRKNENKLYLYQLKYYLKVMNPIKLELLSTNIGFTIEQLKELILKFINKGKLNAKIIKDSLYSQKIEEGIPDLKEIKFFKKIKTIGTRIELHFKLSNPSNYNYKDIQIFLKFSSSLKFLKKESFPKILYLNELKQGNIFKFFYVLKLDKNKKKDLAEPNINKIELIYYFKDPFNINRKTIKEIDILIP